jgi:glycosyltransferase involved in cell wall biosynthesis
MRTATRGLRLGVYTDYAYELVGGEVYAERAFALFLARLRLEFQSLSVIGRLKPVSEGKARYPLGHDVSLIPLPWYASLANPVQVIPTMFKSLVAFWRGLGELDAVWLLGPHPLAIAFALMALLRGKRVVLGVRQDLPTYTRTRHPDRSALVFVAWTLELSFRLLALVCPVVVVGPDLANRYRRSRDVCEIVVSLISEEAISPSSADALGKDYGGELSVLSVGRLDTEKNPLLMVDVLERLEAASPGRWRLRVCGEGPAEEDIRRELAERGLADRCELMGYVGWGDELQQVYVDSHALLHISQTEGFPQVLLEAFAAGLPVVATDVGGIAEAVGDRVLLVPPHDADAPVASLERMATDDAMRDGLIEAGLAFVRAHTIEAESERVASFIRG